MKKESDLIGYFHDRKNHLKRWNKFLRETKKDIYDPNILFAFQLWCIIHGLKSSTINTSIHFMFTLLQREKGIKPLKPKNYDDGRKIPTRPFTSDEILQFLENIPHGECYERDCELFVGAIIKQLKSKDIIEQKYKDGTYVWKVIGHPAGKKQNDSNKMGYPNLWHRFNLIKLNAGLYDLSLRPYSFSQGVLLTKATLNILWKKQG